MTPTLLRLLDVQANTLSTGTTAHLQVAIRTLSLPQVFAHTELWRSGNYSGDFKNSKQHQNSNACKDKGSNGTSLVRHLLSQLRMLLTIRLCRSYLVLSAGPRTPPGGQVSSVRWCYRLRERFLQPCRGPTCYQGDCRH